MISMLLLANARVSAELIPTTCEGGLHGFWGCFRSISEPFWVLLHYMITTMCKEWVDVVESEIIKLIEKS